MDVTHSFRSLKNVSMLLSDFDECNLVDDNFTKGGANCTKNVSMLLSDFDECNLVDDNFTKGGANCTKILGSLNCTCRTQYFWNGMKYEVSFTLILFRPM